jgi:hypothetical protein
LDETQGFRRQDVAGDDEEYRHCEMAAREQDADAREANGVVFAIPPECILENVFSANARVTPNLMMEAEDKECSKASETIKVRSAVQGTLLALL